MPGGVVLAIDQGTSGTKAVVLDPDDGLLATAEVAVHPVYLPDGGVEQDPRELLESVLHAGRLALAQAGRSVDCVALANQGETVLAWDPKTGAPETPAIVWQDRRSDVLCRELAEHGAFIRARTGLELDPYFSAPKMAWLRQCAGATGVVTTTDTWLLHELTGAFVTDAATASRSLVLDVDRVCWDEELLALFGLADSRLPEIVGCDELIGTTDAFGTTVAVGGLVVDQQAALLAEECLEPGSGKCTFGTGAFLLVNAGEQAVRSASGLTTSVAWRTRGGTDYCIDGQVYTAASAVRWMMTLGLVESAADLDRVAADDAGGVLCVPALAGLAAPWWRPDATASLTGMTLSTERGHIVRAVLQGVAAQVAELVELIARDLGRPLERLRVDGGLTRSAVLMQAVADLTQLPLDEYPSAHATALGAAALGRLALDPSLALNEAIVGWTPTRTFTPVWQPDRAAQFRAMWRAAALATLPAVPS